MAQLKVVIESPLSGDFARNIRYARLCALDCVRRGEAPYASHLMFPQFLNDSTPTERRLGMEAGFTWGECGDLRAVYVDLGVSRGMEEGIQKARDLGQTFEFRNLPAELFALLDVGAPTSTVGST